MTLEELKKEVGMAFDRKFMCDCSAELFYDHHRDEPAEDMPMEIKEFINNIIEKAYKEGAKSAIEFISKDQGWEDSEEFYKKQLLK